MSMPWSCRRHACHAMSRIPTLRANRSSTKKKKIEARGSARRAVIHFTFTLGREPARPRKGRAYDVTRRPFETLDPPLPTTGCKSLSDSESDRRDDNDQRWRAGADGFTMWGDWGLFFFFRPSFTQTDFVRARCAYPPLRTGVILRKGPDNAKGSEVILLVAAMPDRFQGTSGLFGLNKVE